MATPLAIAPFEAACDDRRARNESNDSVTLTSKIGLLRGKKHRDGALNLAVCAPHYRFDVEYQPQGAQFAVAQPNNKTFCRASRSFQTLRSTVAIRVTISANLISPCGSCRVSDVYTIHYVSYRMQDFFLPAFFTATATFY